MLIGCELLPQNIELSAQTNMFSDLVYFVDTLSVDNDLGLFRLVGWDNSCKYVDKCCFSCSVVTKYSHKFARLDLNCQLIQCFELSFFADTTFKSFA